MHVRSRARGARGVAVVRLVLGAAVVVLSGAAACPAPAAPTPEQCPSLADACPTLSCVEHVRDDAGCPLCECAVQACADPRDCAPRGVDVFCDVSRDVCEAAPACTDRDAATACPAACYGRCVYADDATSPGLGLCVQPGECPDGGTCRFDVCVDDPRTVGADCSGWCANGCAEVETFAFDPTTGSCVLFRDSCVPPGWITGAEGCR
jgi:hypothetical protein